MSWEKEASMRPLHRLLGWLGRWFERAERRTGVVFHTSSKGFGRGPAGPPRDPYARRPVPLRPRPKSRSGAAAVAEPDDF